MPEREVAQPMAQRTAENTCLAVKSASLAAPAVNVIYISCTLKSPQDEHFNLRKFHPMCQSEQDKPVAMADLYECL